MSPRLVCHRGASLIAPENTFAAADVALDRGAHLIELDVRESADGVLYVMHDKTLDRTTDGTGPIQHRTAAEIDALDAGRW
ncbi:MAG: glycerophosphodiester phosphodiesterase, partial [Proteobacteria bacterium]|nr:glycerophosphodiester phosphodiesterase [Pseudomonadota bacterium]